MQYYCLHSLLRLASFAVVLKGCTALLNEVDKLEYVYWVGCLKNEDRRSTTQLAGEINGYFFLQ